MKGDFFFNSQQARKTGDPKQLNKKKKKKRKIDSVIRDE